MKIDFVCKECGQEFEELGDGKCYACGGSVIPIDIIGQEQKPEEYPPDVMEDEEPDKDIPPEEIPS